MKQLGKEPAEIRFGNMAMSKGFITGEQMVKAIKIQISVEVERGEHKLIGDILVDMGVMNTKQVNKIIKAMKK